jgi:hypothetical protein
MKINRSAIIDRLFTFSQEGNGLIIGKPGVGKSYSIVELSEKLIENHIPVVIFKIDTLLDGSDTSLRNSIDAPENWIDYIDKIKLNNENSKAVLLFDAFDAARDEDVRNQFLIQIAKAISHLKKWHVLVSVRTYDATKSPQLIKLFGNKNLSESISCPHVEIPILELEELESVLADNFIMRKIYNEAGIELKQILRIPFFLRLLEVITSDMHQNELASLTVIKSEVELLDKYWERKISNTENSYKKELLLDDIAHQLIKNKSLSCPKKAFIREQETFKSLRSENIISEVGPNQRYVTFSHNILFDYIVGRLVISSQPTELSNFITEDKSRPFFLRPSFIFHFTQLWYKNRGLFWGNYFHLTSLNELHFNLFKKLIPTSVAANEFRHIDELNHILLTVGSTRNLLQSIRFLKDRKLGTRDIDLLYTLSTDLDVKFLWDFSNVFDRIINGTDIDYLQNFEKCGNIARNFIRYILIERNNNPGYAQSLDRLGATKGIEFVSKTFNSNPEESVQILNSILDFLKEPNFEIWYFSSLADNLKHFVEYSPVFVAKIFYEIFNHKEDSKQETSMGTVTLNLVSNRKQDFEMCYYRLEHFFSTFVKTAPEIAIVTGLKIVNEYVIQDELHSTREKVVILELKIKDFTSYFISDYSSIWHENLHYHKQAQFVDRIISYFKERIEVQDSINLNSLIELYMRNSEVGLTWKKIILFTNEHPNLFIEFSYELMLNQSILWADETTYEMGESIKNSFPFFKKAQRLKVEDTILLLLVKYKKDDNYFTEKKVKRLLNCIPHHFLSRKKSIELLSSSEPILNEPTFKSTWSSEPYTTEKWLADKGVNLDNHENKQIYELQNQLTLFNNQMLNSYPNRTHFEALLQTSDQLFNLIKVGMGILHEDLIESALKNVSEFYSIITRNPSQLEESDYIRATEVIKYSLNYTSKYDKSYNEVQSAGMPYSSTPRIDAADALTNLYRYKREKHLLDDIRKFSDDSNPIVRFRVVRNIRQIWKESPKEFWEIILTRLKQENDPFSLAVILNNLYHTDIIETDEKKVIKAIKIVSTKIGEPEKKDSLLEAYTSLLLYLVDTRKNNFAKAIVRNGIDNTTFMQALLFRLFDFIDPKHPFNDYSKTDNKKDLIELLQEITSKNLSKLIDIPLAELGKDGNEKKRLNLVDFIVQRIYFSLDINDRIKNNRDLQPTEKNKRAFYERMQPILLEILAISQKIGDGFMMAHTAHYLLETLNGVIKFYPEEGATILEMASEITVLSRRSGYPFDHSAIKEIVALTESILADHKHLLRDEKSLEQLISILDLYIESGWTEALELLWKLDEAFK